MPRPSPANLFERASATTEQLEPLCVHPCAKVERIWGPVSTPSSIYDQAHDEWVVLLCGRAQLELDGAPAPLSLRAGDHLLIRAHQRHRVLSASPDALWLAVHFNPAGPSST